MEKFGIMPLITVKENLDLNITEIRMRIMQREDSKLKAIATITIDDCFAIHEIKVFEGREGDLFVRMPSRQTNDGEYKDIAHPLNTPTREKINELVLAKYEEEKNKTV